MANEFGLEIESAGMTHPQPHQRHTSDGMALNDDRMIIPLMTGAMKEARQSSAGAFWSD